MQADRVWRERDVHRAPAGFGNGERAAFGEVDGDAVGRAAIEVESDQVCDVVGARAAGDLGRRSFLDDRAVLDDDETVGQYHRVERIVRDQHSMTWIVGQMVCEIRANARACARIQCGKRFVEQQQRRVGRERSGERDSLRLATGQGARLVGDVIGEVDSAEPVRGAVAGGGAAVPAGT